MEEFEEEIEKSAPIQNEEIESYSPKKKVGFKREEIGKIGDLIDLLEVSIGQTFGNEETQASVADTF